VDSFNTSLFFVAVVPIVVAVLLLLLWRGRSTPKSARDTTIDLVILCREAQQMNTTAFARRFQARWNVSLGCAREEGPVPAESGVAYVLSNAHARLHMQINDKPLHEDFTNALAQAFGPSGTLTEEEIAVMREHKAVVSLFSLKNEGESPLESARFVGMVLLTLLESEAMLGYTIRSSYGYWTRQSIGGLNAITKVTGDELFQLLVNLHVVNESLNHKPHMWIHTHGMDQFQMPDIEMWLPEGTEVAPALDQITSSAIYMIETGNPFIAGQTFDMEGDSSAIHKIAAPRFVSNHDFGSCGAVQIIPAETT